MTSTVKTLCAAASIAATITAGCASSQPIITAQSGAVHANIEAQSIAPPAEQKANTHIPADVTLMDAARERYRLGKAAEPKPQSTQ